MKTILDAPLFKLKPDKAPRQYANVSNRLEIARAGEVYHVLTQVGSGLFTLLRFLKVAPSSSVTMFLDFDQGRAVFGVMVDDLDIFDLWDYAPNLLPPFLD